MRIKIFLFGVLLVFASEYYGSEGTSASTFSCNGIEQQSTIARLKRYLFCEYDQSVRPSESYKNATVVRFRLIIQSMEVDDDINIVDLHSWTSLGWRDFHLRWQPSSYDDMKWLHVKSYEIWVPDIMVHSATDIEPSLDMPHTNCWLNYKGDVYCVPATKYTSYCTPDHTWWPYDVMNCTIQFGLWSHSSEEIEFRLTHTELTMQKYDQNLEWSVERFYTSERVEVSKFGENFDTKLISYHILLKRHASVYSVAFVIPAIVLIAMTLITLWLEPKSMERMIIANLNFVFHLLCMQHLHWRMPYNGTNPPKLLLLYENSLVLAMLSLVLTSILRYVQELKTEAPAWISSGTASILRSKMGQILLVSILDPKVSARVEINVDDNMDLVSSDKKESAWGYVSIIVGWFAFLSVLIAYVVMLAMFLPTSTSGETFKINS